MLEEYTRHQTPCYKIARMSHARRAVFQSRRCASTSDAPPHTKVGSSGPERRDGEMERMVRQAEGWGYVTQAAALYVAQ